MCFVFGGKCPLGHDTKGICGADFDNAFCGVLAEDDILCLDPPHGRGELVCEELDEERVGELLLHLWPHGGRTGREMDKGGWLEAHGLSMGI